MLAAESNTTRRQPGELTIYPIDGVGELTLLPFYPISAETQSPFWMEIHYRVVHNIRINLQFVMIYTCESVNFGYEKNRCDTDTRNSGSLSPGKFVKVEKIEN